jgi:hypothetical protein
MLWCFGDSILDPNVGDGPKACELLGARNLAVPWSTATPRLNQWPFYAQAIVDDALSTTEPRDRPRTVVVLWGSADVWLGLPWRPAIRALRRVVHQLEGIGARVVVVELPPLVGSRAQRRTRARFNTALRKLFETVRPRWRVRHLDDAVHVGPDGQRLLWRVLRRKLGTIDGRRRWHDEGSRGEGGGPIGSSAALRRHG